MGRRPVIAAAVGVCLVAVSLGATAAARGAGGASRVHVPPLPRLGPIQTVDQNDVGDPYIVFVPAGTAMPSGLPYMSSGPNANYASAPWTGSEAETASVHGWYLLVGTTDWISNIPTAVSADLTHWTQAPDALPSLPSWARPTVSMTWAPSVLRTPAGWVLYYSTEEDRSGLECIGRAVSSSPEGPYVDRTAGPLLCQRGLGGSIDPSVIRGPTAEFLVWKDNGNSTAATGIWSQQLTPDGLTVTGRAHLLARPEQAWEKGNVEGPAMVPASRGGYWLFFAGGKWDTDAYATGLDYCQAVTGPCVATSSRPFLSTGRFVISPGGLDTFKDRHGQLWAAFTALVPVPSEWHPGQVYYNRVLDVAPILRH